MILITAEPLDPEATTSLVRRRSNGAVVTFQGVTRDTTADRRVLYLEYEAYRPMADKKLAEIASEVSAGWPIEDIAIAHRVGRLEIGDVSLVVAVASPHRRDAFAASQHVVDRIKQTVPIWKKEFFEGGEVWVESPEDVALRERQAARFARRDRLAGSCLFQDGRRQATNSSSTSARTGLPPTIERNHRSSCTPVLARV